MPKPHAPWTVFWMTLALPLRRWWIRADAQVFRRTRLRARGRAFAKHYPFTEPVILKRQP